MFARHRGFDDGLLNGSFGIICRLFSEVGKTEPAGEFLAGVVSVTAPAASGIGAGGVAQSAHQPSRLGKLMPHPRGHDRVSSGHRYPRQGISQLPGVPVRIYYRLAGVYLACLVI